MVIMIPFFVPLIYGDLMKLLDLFKPNHKVSKNSFLIMVGIQLMFVVGYWFMGKSTYFPTPIEIINAFVNLYQNEDLLPELYASTTLAIEAVIITTIISLIISYANIFPFFRPFTYLVSKFRFLSLVGLSFLFTMMTSSGHELKVSLLVFGMSVF